MDSIRGAKVNMGVVRLGGAGVHYWGGESLSSTSWISPL